MSKQRLPVIVGYGGVSGAGRSSSHHALGRMVYSALAEPERHRTLSSLAALMGPYAVSGGGPRERYILDHSPKSEGGKPSAVVSRVVTWQR